MAPVPHSTIVAAARASSGPVRYTIASLVASVGLNPCLILLG